MEEQTTVQEVQPTPDRVVISQHPKNPTGPHHITCLNSDASSSKWPTVGPTQGLKGPSQWISTDEKSKNRWLSTLGKSMAEVLGLYKCDPYTQKEDWRLSEFPTNYKLFSYVKGTRTDQYLFGSNRVLKFRTANEFLPHLQWLTSVASPGTCQCKYCTGTKSQSDVNFNLGIGTCQPPRAKRKSAPSESVSGLTSPEDSSQEIPHRRPTKKVRSGYRCLSTPTASQQSTELKETRLPTTSGFKGPYTHPDLHLDLGPRGSNFRKHELVWCQITDLIIGLSTPTSPKGFDIGTQFWPGLCEEQVLLVTESLVVDDSDEEPDKTNVGSTPASKKYKSQRTQKAPSTGKRRSYKVDPEQKYRWKVRLLGLDNVFIRDEAELLPWLFRPMNLSQKFSTIPDAKTGLVGYSSDQAWSRPTLDSLSTLDQARIAFLLALQIAANLEECWGGVDRYDHEPDEGDSDAEDSLDQRPWKGDTGTRSSIGSEQTRKTWFQNVWWGAEKIWFQDMVRLNKLEAEIPTELKRSGDDQNGKAKCHLDSCDKAYFLKISGIYRDDIEQQLVTIGKIFDLVAVSPHSQAQALTQKTVKNPSSLHDTSRSPVKAAPLDRTIGSSENESDANWKYMPRPPQGYRFRQLTPSGQYHHVHIDCISGRYYSPTCKNNSDHMVKIIPGLLSKISSDPKVGDKPSDIPRNTHDSLFRQNLSLFGLASGRWNFMRCRKWQESRMKSILEAETLAESEMNSKLRASSNSHI